MPRGDPAEFDLHYHDADEIWYIVEGRARILTEGVEHEVGPGDIVCTGMGELEGLKRPGHLHRDEHGVPVPQRRTATAGRA